MGGGVSDAVEDVLKDYHYLKPAFRHGTVNYSAFARLIKPAVDKRIGGKAGLDAIIAALRRAAPKFSVGESLELRALLAECDLRLRNDMVCVHYKRSPELFSKLISLEREVNWEGAERMYVIQRTEEISVIATRKFYRQLLELGGRKGELILDSMEHLALLTVIYPREGIDAIGFLSLLASQFATAGVTILLHFASFSHLSFLIHEKDAPAMFERLGGLMREAAANKK